MISKHMSISSINSNLIPVRMLTQFAYCKRLAYMEWVQGEFESNKVASDMAETKFQHNADTLVEKTKKKI